MFYKLCQNCFSSYIRLVWLCSGRVRIREMKGCLDFEWIVMQQVSFVNYFMLGQVVRVDSLCLKDHFILFPHYFYKYFSIALTILLGYKLLRPSKTQPSANARILYKTPLSNTCAQPCKLLECPIPNLSKLIHSNRCSASPLYTLTLINFINKNFNKIIRIRQNHKVQQIKLQHSIIYL